MLLRRRRNARDTNGLRLREAMGSVRQGTSKLVRLAVKYRQDLIVPLSRLALEPLSRIEMHLAVFSGRASIPQAHPGSGALAVKTLKLPKKLALTAALSLSSACTYGSVTDASTNEPIADPVAVIFFAWDTSRPNVGDTPASLRATNSVQTWGTSDPRGNDAAGWYYLNPYAPQNPADGTPTIVQPGWFRVVLFSFSGIPVTSFYRNHQYQDRSILHDSPYSGDSLYATGVSYPFSYASGSSTGLCAAEHFTVLPTGVVHPVLPDLIADPRTLRVSDITGIGIQSLECPLADCQTSKCLSVSTGIANVGTGSFEASAVGFDNARVRQRVYNSDRTFTDIPLPEASIGFADGHGHFHLQDLVIFRLRPYMSACPTEITAPNCPVVQTSRSWFLFLRQPHAGQPVRRLQVHAV